MPRTPHYQRIVEDIRRQIEAGELRPGDQLPSAAQLRKHYGVGNTAVRNAMIVLRTEGLIEGHVGKGVYIAPRTPPNHLAMPTSCPQQHGGFLLTK